MQVTASNPSIETPINSSFELKHLGLLCAIIEKSAIYLTGTEIKVYTDNLFAYLKSAKLGALEQRWVAWLARFGQFNSNAGTLSRFPGEEPIEDRHLSQ